MPSPIVQHLKKLTSPQSSTIGFVKNANAKLHRTPNHSKLVQPSLGAKKFTCARKLFEINATENFTKPPVSVPTIQINSKVIPSVDSPDRHKIKNYETNQYDYFILGKGSFGVVILSEYKGETVATKLVHLINTNVQMSLKKESNSKGLIHPNIILLIDVKMSIDYGFVIMEAMVHEDLQTLINKEILLLEDKIRYLQDVCNAIMYCHKCRILHLDIKPKNILVNASAKLCKICDFGNSFKMDATDLKAIQWHHQGTVVYSSPELLKGEIPTEKCDVYSLGITIWQILHQETPYEGLSKDLVIYSVVSANCRPNSSRKGTLTEFKELYEKCWDSVPNDRPAVVDVKKYLRDASTAVERSNFKLDNTLY